MTGPEAFSAFSVIVSAVFVVYARRAAGVAMKAEKRASESASRAGQLASVRVERAEEDNYSLVAVNGPDEVVIDHLTLTVTYVEPPDNSVLPGMRITFDVSPADFGVFGFHGLALPKPLAPRHKIQWTMPRGRPEQDGARVEYKWCVVTAHGACASATWIASRGNQRYTLLKRRRGRPLLFWLWVMNNYGPGEIRRSVGSGRLADLITVGGLPESAQCWLLRRLENASN